MAQTTQDVRKANDEAAKKGPKVEPRKQASLADCIKQFQDGLKPAPAAKPAPKVVK